MRLEKISPISQWPSSKCYDVRNRAWMRCKVDRWSAYRGIAGL